MTDRERLVELINGKTHTMKFQNSDHWFDFQQKCEEIADYLVSNGVIVLPCKVGDTVYKITTQRDNFDDEEYSIVIQIPFTIKQLNSIDKTVFLTREEAEKVLKERENNA